MCDPAVQQEWNAELGSRLKIEVEDMSNQLVMVMPNPNLNIVEDRVRIPEPKVKDITLAVARISYLSKFFNELDQFERPFFFHKYPRLS